MHIKHGYAEQYTENEIYALYADASVDSLVEWRLRSDN